MNAINNPHITNDHFSFGLSEDHSSSIDKVKNLDTSQQLTLPNRIVSHHPKSGLNPLVDAAGYLFSVLGKLKQIKTFRQLGKLQKELLQEINAFQATVKKHGYNPELIIICRYLLCATFDDVISHSTWGGHGQWDGFSVLAAYNQDPNHQEKFFSILERAIKEPTVYIDLMELAYLCLSMGYKGNYRSTEHSQYQLELITNNLYKHIRAFRGNFGKMLSPIQPKLFHTAANAASQGNASILYVFFATVCINTIIFVSLGYLMDVISNEAYKNISEIQTPVIDHTAE